MCPINLYLIHAPDPAKLETVKDEMRRMGTPEVRVVDCGDHYMALEGCHRLCAAAALGISPNLTVLKEGDIVDTSSLGIACLAASDEVWTAGELADELFGGNNPFLTIECNGTLRGSAWTLPNS